MNRTLPHLLILGLLWMGGGWQTVFAQSVIPVSEQPSPSDEALPSDNDHYFDTEQSIQYALVHNKDLANATLDQYINQQAANELIAQGYPQVDGSVDLVYYGNLPTNVLPGELNFLEPGKPYPVQFGTPWNSNAGFSLKQLVFDGTFFIGLKASKSYVEMARRQKNQTAEEVATSVSKAYYQALVSEVYLDIIDANIERTKKLFGDTKALFEEGFAERIDVERLQISLTNLELERTRMERLAQLSKDMLKFQMGMPVTDELTLTEDIQSLRQNPVVGEGLSEINPEARIEYRVLQNAFDLENYNMRRFKAGYWPTLYGFGTYIWNAQRQEFNFFSSEEKWFPISSVGLNLKVPIFDGFRKRSQVQQSRLKIQQIENNMTNLENSITLQVRNTRAILLNNFNNLESYRKNMELAKEVLRVSELKYKEGVGSSLEVNDADSQFKQAQANYLSGFFDFLESKVEYERATGEYARYHLD